VVDEDIVRVEDPEPPELRTTLVGPREAVSPEEVTELASDTVPAKP